MEDSRDVQFRKAIDDALNNLEYADDKDVARAYLKLKEEAQERAAEAQETSKEEAEWELEVQRELQIGDLLTRRRMADDMLRDGMEFSGGPDEPWHYGSLTVHREEPESGPERLSLKDFDGVNQGIIPLSKAKKQDDPVMWLQEELDEREQEVYKQL